MKRILKSILRISSILTLLTICVVLPTQAQQEPQYTQYMWNKLPINAAYAGGRDVLSLRAIYRNQWTGIEGNPWTVSFSGHSPLKNENFAIGGFMVHDELGVTKQTWIDGDYAYRIKVGKDMRLSLGINVGMLMYKANLTDLNLNNPGDPVFSENVSRIMPDVGAGIYFYSPHFYVGVSVPNFISSELYNKDQELFDYQTAQRVPHLFGMAGGVIPMGNILKLRPQLITESVMSSEYKAPLTMNANLSFMLFDRLSLGASYRTTIGNNKDEENRSNGDGFDAMMEVWPTKQLMIGYAYDFTTSALQDAVNGTHEIILGYDFQFDKKKILTPRYF